MLLNSCFMVWQFRLPNLHQIWRVKIQFLDKFYKTKMGLFFIFVGYKISLNLNLLKMKYKIIIIIFFAILLQTNAVYVSAQILNSTDNKELGIKRNASYNLEEIKVRWKKAALENCPGLPCVVTPPPSAGPCPTATVTDIDGNIYNTVSIGTHCWTKENLRTTKYTDGTAIPLNSTGGVAGNVSGEDWSTQTTGQRTIYAQSSGNLTDYGYLYNWFAVKGISISGSNKNICPTGWHVPTDAEWTVLTTHLDGVSVAGGKMKAISSLWAAGSNGGATDESGFSALPGGKRLDLNGLFNEGVQYGYFWSSTENPSQSTRGFYRYVWYDNTAVDRSSGDKKSGYAVRCIKTQFVP